MSAKIDGVTLCLTLQRGDDGLARLVWDHSRETALLGDESSSGKAAGLSQSDSMSDLTVPT